MMAADHSAGVCSTSRCQRVHTRGRVVLNQVKRAAASLWGASGAQKHSAREEKTSSRTSSVACCAGEGTETATVASNVDSIFLLSNGLVEDAVGLFAGKPRAQRYPNENQRGSLVVSKPLSADAGIN